MEQNKVSVYKQRQNQLEVNKTTEINYVRWKTSIEAKIDHENLVKEEARKMRKHPGYKTRLKIGKKYKHLL